MTKYGFSVVHRNFQSRGSFYPQCGVKVSFNNKGTKKKDGRYVCFVKKNDWETKREDMYSVNI